VPCLARAGAKSPKCLSQKSHTGSARTRVSLRYLINRVPTWARRWITSPGRYDSQMLHACRDAWQLHGTAAEADGSREWIHRRGYLHCTRNNTGSHSLPKVLSTPARSGKQTITPAGGGNESPLKGDLAAALRFGRLRPEVEDRGDDTDASPDTTDARGTGRSSANGNRAPKENLVAMASSMQRPAGTSMQQLQQTYFVQGETPSGEHQNQKMPTRCRERAWAT
jgi:hypothetical protein